MESTEYLVEDTHPIVYSALQAHASDPEDVGVEAFHANLPTESSIEPQMERSGKLGLVHSAMQPMLTGWVRWRLGERAGQGVGYGPLCPRDVMWRYAPPVPAQWRW
jgi:hypothetical protein